ncbi:uncharacterized protein LOC129238317 [Anastrepha obliqua]|uniref:uncharacterized protein LOC129238317 n=1 Tax=Anastrepha obliqua TaxID=95512 RepID=UPI0024090410|nr:uncharacterized protein LOC129238317 [Anastrepha obliqua]
MQSLMSGMNASEEMATFVKVLLVVCFCCQHLWITKGATLSSLRINHAGKTQQRNTEYLPPHTTENYAEKPNYYTSNTVRQSTYQSQQVNKVSHPLMHFTSRNLSNAQQSHTKLYTSYAAPASGLAPFPYSAPQRTNQGSLPTLYPKSLGGQLTSAAASQSQELEWQQQQQQQHQQYADIPKHLIDLPLANAPLLMIEEPTASLLTPSQNITLEAARILASTLLEANGEAPLETPGLAPLSNPNALDLPNSLNSTDVFIVKSQKNAYIIPTPLAKDARNPANVRALYQMRDQLDKAYTINQFIFIIKPERINFLNKLV